MRLFQQDETTAAKRDIFVQMVDENDFVTAETGLTLTVEIVKAGEAAYAGIAGSSSEIGSGTYKISLAAADLDTLGEAMLKVTATGAATQFIPLQVATIPSQVTAILADTDEIQGKLPTGDISDFDESTDKVTLAAATHTGAVVPTVTTLTGHTAQSGDCYTRIGAPAGASVSADVAAVKADTAATLTDTDEIQGKLPTGDFVDSDAVNAACDTALSDINLDHLAKTACPSNLLTGAVADNTIIAHLAAESGDISDYSNATDSQEVLGTKIAAIQTRLGAAIAAGSLVTADDDITLYLSDDNDGLNALTWTITGYTSYDLTEATGVFLLLNKATYESGSEDEAAVEAVATLSQDGTTVSVSVALTAADKADLTAIPSGQRYNYRYQVRAITDTDEKVVTLVDGNASVYRNIEAIPEP